MMGNKKEFRYFLVVNSRKVQELEYMLKLIELIIAQYPHLDGKLDVVDSLTVEYNSYIIARSI